MEYFFQLGEVQSVALLIELNKSCIDDEGVLSFANAISGLDVMKLRLDGNKSVTKPGWKAVSKILLQNKSLEELYLMENNIDDEVVGAFASALCGGSLNTLWFGTKHEVTVAGWTSLSNRLLNKSSKLAAQSSNHVLTGVCYAGRPLEEVTGLRYRKGCGPVPHNLPDDLLLLLELNKNEDKDEVAQQKVLLYHLWKLCDVETDIGLNLLPFIAELIGKRFSDENMSQWITYRFLRSTPTLFGTA